MTTSNRHVAMFAASLGMALLTLMSFSATAQEDAAGGEAATRPQPETESPPPQPVPEEGDAAPDEGPEAGGESTPGAEAEAGTESQPEAEVEPSPEPESEPEPEPEEDLQEDVTLEEPFVPEMEDDRVEYDDGDLEEALEAVSDGKPFAKGEKELGLGLGMAGYGDQYYIGIGASFAYYVINGLAPGLSLNYTTDFGSTDMADSITVLPYLKWVFFRSWKFSPYVVVDAGKEWQWAGEYPVHSWIAGGGFGAHIGIGRHVMINISILFQHHWYDETVIRKYPDNSISCYVYDDGTIAPQDPMSETCTKPKDDKDVDREWIYPIINLGVSIMF